VPVRLSVVIPSHNGADLLRLCLASVQRHIPAGAEVVVVDDGSPDATVTATARAFPGVRVLRLEKQSGFCAAANAGMQSATHPIVELLNDDAEVEVGWAEAALKWFAEPTVAAVSPLVLRRSDADGPPRIDSAGDRYYLGGVAGKRGHGRFLTAEYLNARPVFGASASSAFYRREAVLSVGGFPESFSAYSRMWTFPFACTGPATASFTSRPRASGIASLLLTASPVASFWSNRRAMRSAFSGAICRADFYSAPCRRISPSSQSRRTVAGARANCFPSFAAS